MAAPPKRKGYTIKFELSLVGLLGVGVVCFCVFLWMFLFGVWAGQNGLISGLTMTSLPVFPAAAPGESPKGPLREPPPVAAEPETAPAPLAEIPPPPASPGEEDAPGAAEGEPQAQAVAPSGYALQVGAFRDGRHAEAALREWRAKGYEVFSLPPGQANEHLTKVCLGPFPDADAARKEAKILAAKDKITPVVVAIPAVEAKRS